MILHYYLLLLHGLSLLSAAPPTSSCIKELKQQQKALSHAHYMCRLQNKEADTVARSAAPAEEYDDVMTSAAADVRDMAVQELQEAGDAASETSDWELCEHWWVWEERETLLSIGHRWVWEGERNPQQGNERQ